ncbi:hypothetical protein GKZ89_05260 [Bacillus mangrovi]|uniref:Nucleoside-diphosphate sugar epimerase n=1 Tax=Metabacillus mangrovi TaxID=1491830 RepID=A0A7X2S3Y6_9BACI|nr:hypothetical protein [Metabacillus mangrovi]MTH52810.1 hypothetical protein [Metabacillus mangrovi]
MIYKQTNTILKMIESILLSIGCILLVFWFAEEIPVLDEVLWSAAIVLTALRYGTAYGLIPFGSAVISLFVYEVVNGGDLYLFLTDLNSVLVIFLLFFLLLSSGLTKKAYSERYTDITNRYEEILEEKNLLVETLDEALAINGQYKKRFLEAEDQYSEMYDMITALNLTESDPIFNEMVRIVNQRFKTRQLILYLISSQGDSLRSKINTNSHGKLKANYLFDEMPSLLKRVLAESQKVQFHSAEDDDFSPAAAAPVFVFGEKRYILALDGISLSSCTSQQIQWLDWCLKWMGNRLSFAYRYERERNQHDMYLDTGIYRIASFFKRFNAELERAEKIGQPFVIFEISTKGLSIGEIDLLMKKQLRELDSAGWDEERNVLYVLLPGVDPSNEGAVRKRLQRAVEKEAGLQL